MIKSRTSAPGGAKPFSLPNIRGIQPASDRGTPPPDGSYVLEVLKCTYFDSQGYKGIRVSFKIAEIEKQYETRLWVKATATMAAHLGDDTMARVEVGSEVEHTCFFGQKYGYGEADWVGFLMACGFETDDQREEAQEHAIGAENPLAGAMVRYKRQSPKAWFHAYEGEAEKVA